MFIPFQEQQRPTITGLWKIGIHRPGVWPRCEPGDNEWLGLVEKIAQIWSTISTNPAVSYAHRFHSIKEPAIHSVPAKHEMSRREFFGSVGVGIGGLMLGDPCRLRAGENTPRPKSVIMVLLIGGPAHIDMYDMKPDAPVEIRGEFKPIRTNVPGIEICEHMPRQAKLADKLTIVRNMKFTGDNHSGEQLTTGLRSDNKARIQRPAHGAIVSFLREKDSNGPAKVPAYVLLSPPMRDGPVFRDEFGPLYAGSGHRAFTPTGPAFDDLGLSTDMTHERLGERKDLLQVFDTMRRDLDSRAELAGMDRFTARAFEMLTSSETRTALDISQEPERVREKYGIRGPHAARATRWLQARRLVEAGVPVVNFRAAGQEDWDTHTGNFSNLKQSLLPTLDIGLSALVSDLHDRGLDKDVVVVVWGEMGRTPKVTNKAGGGRDHWHDSSFAVLAGGGWPMGQVIGKTDAWGAAAIGTPYTPQNVLATLYRHLGIDPKTTLLDFTGRPQTLLDDCTPIREFL